MNSTERNFQTGMDVVDVDGVRLGAVTKVYRPTDALPIDNDPAFAGADAEPNADVDLERGPSSLAGVPDPGLIDMVEEYDAEDTGGARPVDAAEDRNVSSGFNTGIVELGSGRRSSYGIDNNPAANTSGTGSMAETGYVVVDYGGFLGLGQTELFIPFDAIQTVDGEGSLALTCTKVEAEDRFQARPPFVT